MAVFAEDTQIGVIVEYGNDFLNGPLDAPTVVRYRIESAGAGIPIPQGRFTSREDAAAAIVLTRREHAAVHTTGPDGLTGFERAALEFELTPQANATDGTRDREITERFAMTVTEYSRRLADLFNDPTRRAAAFRSNLAAARHVTARMARNRARRRRTRRQEEVA